MKTHEMVRVYQYIRDHVSEDHFSMIDFINVGGRAFRHFVPEVTRDWSECGTVGCIAGWTVALNYTPFEWKERLTEMGGERVFSDVKKNPHLVVAAEILGLTTKQAQALFVPNPIHQTKEAALGVMREMIDRYIDGKRLRPSNIKALWRKHGVSY